MSRSQKEINDMSIPNKLPGNLVINLNNTQSIGSGPTNTTGTNQSNQPGTYTSEQKSNLQFNFENQYVSNANLEQNEEDTNLDNEGEEKLLQEKYNEVYATLINQNIGRTENPKYWEDLNFIKNQIKIQTDLTFNVQEYIKENGTTQQNKDRAYTRTNSKVAGYVPMFGRVPGHGLNMSGNIEDVKENPEIASVISFSSSNNGKVIRAFLEKLREHREEYVFVIANSDPGSADNSGFSTKKNSKVEPDYFTYMAIKNQILRFFPELTKNLEEYAKAIHPLVPHTQTAIIAIPKEYFS